MISKKITVLKTLPLLLASVGIFATIAFLTLCREP